MMLKLSKNVSNKLRQQNALNKIHFLFQKRIYQSFKTLYRLFGSFDRPKYNGSNVISDQVKTWSIWWLLALGFRKYFDLQPIDDGWNLLNRRNEEPSGSVQRNCSVRKTSAEKNCLKQKDQDDVRRTETGGGNSAAFTFSQLLLSQMVQVNHLLRLKPFRWRRAWKLKLRHCFCEPKSLQVHAGWSWRVSCCCLKDAKDRKAVKTTALWRDHYLDQTSSRC